MAKLRIGVLFGGRSAEHEVSLVSATSVVQALDRSKYDVTLIGISHEGRWLSSADALQMLKSGAGLDAIPEQLIVPDPRKQALVEINGTSAAGRDNRIDVILPVMHGTFGEDGTIQGLFELADIPYVGAGVLGSAVGMDKVVQKELLRQAKIPVTPSCWFTFGEYRSAAKRTIASVERTLRYPMFVKPANSGSSIGISKAHDRKELIAAIDLAGQYDRKILVEQGVPHPREIECSVLGNDAPEASVLGEIIPSNEFYDYDAKYVDGKSASAIPAKLPAAVAKRIRATAIAAFRALDCAGMARVDFLVNGRTNRIYLNEINTIPGFTSISMYPKLWQASGLSYSALLDRLIALAQERHAAKKQLKTTYQPKEAWYQA